MRHVNNSANHTQTTDIIKSQSEKVQKKKIYIRAWETSCPLTVSAKGITTNGTPETRDHKQSKGVNETA